MPGHVLTNRVVDTCALARRLVRDEVPNCRLATLAEHLRLTHRPSHRALDDALATADLLHALLERAGSLGVLGLDDLLELPTIRAHPQVESSGSPPPSPAGRASTSSAASEAVSCMWARRCTQRPGRVTRDGPCSPAQLGMAAWPCAGTVSEADYGVLVRRVVDGLTVDPALLLDPLRARMAALARRLVDELACVASWLDAEAGRVRLVHCDGELASCLPPILRVKPARATAKSRS